MHSAANFEKTEAISALVRANPQLINVPDIFGDTALHRTVSAGQTEAIPLLIVAGAHLNFKNNRGSTVLHVVAKEGNVEAIRLLIEAVADKNAKDQEGRTALHLLAANRKKGAIAINEKVEVIRLLKAAGADINAKDRSGRIAFEYASENGQTDVEYVLLDKGAEINEPDEYTSFYYFMNISSIVEMPLGSNILLIFLVTALFLKYKEKEHQHIQTSLQMDALDRFE